MSFGFTESDGEQARANLLDCARTYCPSRSERGRQSLEVRPEGLGGRLFGISYLIFTITGTDAHEIYPREKKALWWPLAPGGHPWAHVHHPGTQANDWRVKTMQDCAQRVRPLLREVGQRNAAELKARILA